MYCSFPLEGFRDIFNITVYTVIGSHFHDHSSGLAFKFILNSVVSLYTVGSKNLKICDFISNWNFEIKGNVHQLDYARFCTISRLLFKRICNANL